MYFVTVCTTKWPRSWTRFGKTTACFKLAGPTMDRTTWFAMPCGTPFHDALDPPPPGRGKALGSTFILKENDNNKTKEKLQRQPTNKSQTTNHKR